jgi:uncharacterized protein (TIGR00725 family)
MRKRQVVVIGSSDDRENVDEAYRIGEFIARREMVLISGGRGGIMEAASRGASDGKGIVIGIIPGEGLDQANRYCSIVIPTGIGFARNVINVLSADCIIAIGGKSGTLTELAYAWQFGKPIICCTFAGGWSARLPTMPIDDRGGGPLYEAEKVEDVFNILDDLLKG